MSFEIEWYPPPVPPKEIQVNDPWALALVFLLGGVLGALALLILL
jgi:hypothetical protein